MARMTRTRRGAPRWTRDDILREAATTFALLPRPSAAARGAFTALLAEFWTDVSEGTRTAVEDVLRGSTRVGIDILETLDALIAGIGPGVASGVAPDITSEPAADGRPALIARAVSVSHRPGMKVAAAVSGRARAALPVEEGIAERPASRITVAAPPLANESLGADTDDDAVAPPTRGTTKDATKDVTKDVTEDAADHARAVIAHLATGASDAAPALQPVEIEATLHAAPHPGPALAALLDISVPRAESVVSLPRARGTAVALRALGIAPGAAEAMVMRWRGRAPNGFAAHYASLTLADCLDAVAAWRRQDGALNGAANRGPGRASGIERRSA